MSGSEAYIGLSDRAVRVCEWFGIEPASGWMHEARDGVALPEVRVGEIVLLTGASGSGKSSVLRGYLRAREDGVEVVDVGALAMPETRIVDLYPGLRFEPICRADVAPLLTNSRWFMKTVRLAHRHPSETRNWPTHLLKVT